MLDVPSLGATAGALAGLDAYRTARAAAGRRLLLDPVARWERRRPFRRALAAVETHDRHVQDLVRSLPDTVEVPDGGALVEALGATADHRFLAMIARVRRRARPLRLRALVASEIDRLAPARLGVEVRFLTALARAYRLLRTEWDLERNDLDRSALERPAPSEDLAKRHAEAEAAVQALDSDARRALEAWSAWSETAPRAVARRALIGAPPRRAPRRGGTEVRAWAKEVWADQYRVLEGETRLEASLLRFECDEAARFRLALDGLESEKEALATELDRSAEWLRAASPGDRSGDFPPPVATVVPATSRLAELEAGYRAGLQAIPQPAEALGAFTPSPRRRRPRTLLPRDNYLAAFAGEGASSIAEVLAEIESRHRSAMQAIERAREVVAYGLEPGPDGEPDEAVAAEALENALALVEYEREGVHDWRAPAERRLLHALAAVFADAHARLGRDRLGDLTYFAGHGARRAVVLTAGAARTAAAASLRRAARAVALAWGEILVRIGWRPAPTRDDAQVVVRPALPAEFTVDLASKELPAIYRRLFRLEPVEDPRFLVGRERERAAIADARATWEAGRPVGVLIVGERGSGKTSLINCVLKEQLDGLEVIRGEINRRVVTAADLRRFLADVVGLDDPSRLEEALGSRRRVFILEEVERAFLRQVGHYGAMRALQAVVAATYSTTLWILVTNQVAFRFLDAAVGLGTSFSHLVNASKTSRDALRDAILLRHNLSGLRLRFGQPAERRTLGTWLRGSLRPQADPEAMFFDALARESHGVFRAAFDIWLGHVEGVDAGVLSLKPIVVPDLTSVVAALDQADLFSLVAVMQHGSLTHEEHASVFQTAITSSRAQIDELLARELLEPDPGRPGFRVRPEAMGVVKEALYRRNLL